MLILNGEGNATAVLLSWIANGSGQEVSNKTDM